MNRGAKRILLIEDETGLVLALTDRLTSEGYFVLQSFDGSSGLQMAIEKRSDLIILDVMLPRMNGFDVLRDLRRHGITTPVLMLTARGELTEKIVGLKLGADDYLTKPFEMLELLARIESLLRRPASMVVEGSTLVTHSFGPFTVDLRKMEVRQEGKLLDLSTREFQLLRYLIEHRHTALSREVILNDVWGVDAMPSTRTIDTHVTWLRQKLEDNPKYPKYILTIHGFGYKFVG